MRRAAAVSTTLVALGLLGVCAGATAGTDTQGHWLGLADGDVGAFHWSVEAKRAEDGAQAPRRPCLMVGTTWRTGRYSYRRSRSRQCAGAAALSATGPPLVAKGVQPSSGQRAKVSAVGMIFAPAARRLEVTLAGGATKTLRLVRLSSAQAHTGGLAPFRYAAFAARGEWCAERLVAENGAGRVLWDSGTDGYTCGEAAAQPKFDR